MRRIIPSHIHTVYDSTEKNLSHSRVFKSSEVHKLGLDSNRHDYRTWHVKEGKSEKFTVECRKPAKCGKLMFWIVCCQRNNLEVAVHANLKLRNSERQPLLYAQMDKTGLYSNRIHNSFFSALFICKQADPVQ